MVRTKADCGGSSATRKAVAARAPRKALGSASTLSTSDGTSPAGNKYGGGNPVCPRPTPEWQKGITNFFITGKTHQIDKENSIPVSQTTELQDEPVAGCSGSSKDDS